MTSEKLKSLFAGYRELLNAAWPDDESSTLARQLSEPQTKLYSGSLALATVQVAHCKFMCDEAIRFVDEGRVDKAIAGSV